jgi:hypothetical protein
LAEFMELIRLPLQCGFWNVVAAELFHEFIPGDGGGILGCCAVVLPLGQGCPSGLVSCQENLVAVLTVEGL